MMDTCTTSVKEHLGRAMGSKLHIIATGDQATIDPIVAWAVDRIHELEQRWSRFIPTSEVSRVNAAAGSHVSVSADTITLVSRALEARDLSGGRFDPTLLQAMLANGYDRTFVSINTPIGLPALDLRRHGFGQVTIDYRVMTVSVAPCAGFDPGGIGKGLAADLVAEEMIARGAAGALVNVGGDIRCLGAAPDGGSWAISVGDERAEVDNEILHLEAGAVATSTRCRRRWKRADASGVVDTHHLLDATSGQASSDAANLVTVVAGSCADAEWLATAIASEGRLPADRSMIGEAAVMMTDHHGEYTTYGPVDRFVQ